MAFGWTRRKLVPGSVVFSAPDHPIALDDHYRWWSYIRGANWRHPERSNSNIKDRMNHPVVHIAYEDAVAYCKWAGKRLPTEAEFEFASRGGLDRKRYVWGDEFMPGGKHMANTLDGFTTRPRLEATSQTLTRAKTGTGQPPRWDRFHLMAMVCSIWQAMYGNGLQIGTALITTEL